MKYMYTSPEDIVLRKISQNRGTQNFMDKSDLIILGLENGVDVNNKMLKKDIAYMILSKIGYAKLSSIAQIGVTSRELQERFGITNEEVKRMAKGNYITIVGKEHKRIYGKEIFIDLYSPDDYFKSEEEVIRWIVDHPRRKANKIK